MPPSRLILGYLDPSIRFGPLTAGLLAPASHISKRSSVVGSILSRFRKPSRHQASQKVSHTLESDRESLKSSLPSSAAQQLSRFQRRRVSAVAHKGTAEPRPGYLVTPPALYIPNKYVRSTRPPSANRFRSDVPTPDKPCLIPKLTSSSAWISEDASPAIIRAEIHRIKVEALQLESFFREAELMERRDLNLFTTGTSSTPTPYPAHDYIVHFDDVRSSGAATQTVEQASALFRHSNMRESPGSKLAEVNHENYQQLAMAATDLERRRVEADSRYGRKLEFLSARLEAAELRLQARR